MMLNNEILQKILLSYIYDNGSPPLPDELKLIAEGTTTLSKMFTRDRDNLPSDYLKDKNLRRAYILYFLQANLYKIHIPLRELSMHPANLFLKDRLRILDVGSGPGTAILGIFDFFAQYNKKPFLEFVAIDSVVENLRDAEGIFKLYMDEKLPPPLNPLPRGEGRYERLPKIPPPLMGGGEGEGGLRRFSGEECYFRSSLTTIKMSIEKIKNLPHGPFDLIVFSNLLSEVCNNDPERIEKRVKILKRFLNDFMSDNGTCIIIEPALRETSREMLQVRDGLLQEGFHVYSPCLMDKHCPALENPKDWCHEDIPWDPPELIKNIDNLTGLRKDSIKFSYLVIRKDKIFLADLYGEDSYRIVSEPLISKGKIEFYICSSSGRQLVMRLDKDRSPLNKAFEEMKRGDVVQLDGVQNNGKRLRVGKDCQVKLVQAI